MKKAWVLSYPFSAQRRLWSDWADAQADLSLCWAHRPTRKGTLGSTACMHSHSLCRAREVELCLKLPLVPYILWANNEGSRVTVQKRRLTWAFAVRLYDKYLYHMGWLSYIYIYIHNVMMDLFFKFRVIVLFVFVFLDYRAPQIFRPRYNLCCHMLHYFTCMWVTNQAYHKTNVLVWKPQITRTTANYTWATYNYSKSAI